MFRFPIGFMAALALVLGAYCVSRSNAAEKSSAPAKSSSAASAPATGEKPAATASPAAAEPAAAEAAGSRGRFASGMGVGEKVRSLGNRQPAQPTVPSEPLAVLKSGPDHTRLVYHLKWKSAVHVSQTVSQLLRQEGELHGTAGTAAKGGPALRVAIAPEVVANCLVISGPPDAVEEVRLLAEKLDEPAPMVQFEMEMGEAPAGDAKHGEALASEGGAPPAERPNAFRILERPKTMQTTARARVLTLNNQPAFIQLGQRVPRVAGVSNNAAQRHDAIGYDGQCRLDPGRDSPHQRQGRDRRLASRCRGVANGAREGRCRALGRQRQGGSFGSDYRRHHGPDDGHDSRRQDDHPRQRRPARQDREGIGDHPHAAHHPAGRRQEDGAVARPSPACPAYARPRTPAQAAPDRQGWPGRGCGAQVLGSAKGEGPSAAGGA